MNDSIFRKKSLDRLTSPEQLSDYIHVSSPGIWLLLGAVIALLAGVCVWGVFGALDTTVPAAAVCKDGVLTCYISEADGAAVKAGMEVTAGDQTAVLKDVSAEPVQLSADTDPYLLHLGNLDANAWVYKATASLAAPDGSYAASIVTERISPMKFVIN